MSRNEVAKQFWGKQTLYPDAFIIDHAAVPISYIAEVAKQIREIRGDFCKIPQTGRLMDIGGGSATHLYLPEDLDRTVVVDFSESLLSQSRVPPENRYLRDIGTDTLPAKWKEGFAFAQMIYVSRYLYPEQRLHAYGQIYRILAPGSNFFLVDMEQTADQELGPIVGQVGTFDCLDEERTLGRLGFTDVFSFPFVRTGHAASAPTFSFEVVIAKK